MKFIEGFNGSRKLGLKALFLATLGALCLVGPLGPNLGFASTFVGNGGSAGDLELYVGLEQMKTGLREISSRKSGDGLCRCREDMQGQGVCDTLRTLNQEQKSFCGEVLYQKSSELLESLNSGGIQFKWTHDRITVQGKDRLQAADAVADPAAGVVTVNVTRYLAMNAIDRVFLLGHEIFHFAEWDGQLLVDEAPLGPFTRADGQRHLLNAMAAAMVMQVQAVGGFDQYNSALRRSKAWRRSWLDLSFGQVNNSGSQSNSPYASDNLGLWELSFRHYLSSGLGAIVRLRTEAQDESLLSTIRVSEQTTSFGLGVSYRLFPFSNPLTAWGQSHLALGLLAEYLVSEHQLNEAPLSVKAESKSLGASLECKYYMPLHRDLWLHAAISLQFQQIEFQEVGLKYEPLRHIVTLGASYGF